MKGQPFKAIVIKHVPNISDTFALGDEITCYPEFFDKEVQVAAGWKYPVDKEGNTLPVIWHKPKGKIPFRDYDLTNFDKYIIVPPVIQHVGNFKYLILVDTKGNEYSSDWLINRIGFLPITDWLKRLN